MRLHPHEFIRRFLMHVLPKGFHRIRHYGLFANANRAENIATARALLNVAPPARRPARAAGYRHGHATCAALPLPALWRPHDRDRGVRTRLRAEVASDAQQDRHIMSRTALERRDFPVPMRWPCKLAAIPLDPSLHALDAAVRSLISFQALAEMPTIRFNLRSQWADPPVASCRCYIHPSSPAPAIKSP